jgi:hypothetical protein
MQEYIRIFINSWLLFCNLEFEIIFALITGEMPEWSIGAVSKTVVPFGVPRVRIPLSPQKKINPAAKLRDFILKGDSSSLEVPF